MEYIYDLLRRFAVWLYGVADRKQRDEPTISLMPKLSGIQVIKSSFLPAGTMMISSRIIDTGAMDILIGKMNNYNRRKGEK